MKLILAAMLLFATLGASAQHSGAARVVSHPRPVMHVGSRTTFGYGYGYGYGNRLYNPNYPSPYQSYSYRPSKLEVQINEIEADFRDKKRSVRMDKSLDRQQRKEMIRNLRSEKNRSVEQAKRDYYKR